MKLKYRKAQRILFRDIPTLIVGLLVIGCIRWGTTEGSDEHQEPLPGELLINPDENGENRYYAQAGDEVTFVLKCWWMARESWDGKRARFMVNFLLPKSWNASKIYDITYVDSRDGKTYSFELETDPPNVGKPLTWNEALMYNESFKGGNNMGNLGGLEWVTFKTVESYEVWGNNVNASLVITAKFKASDENLSFKPAFYITHSNHGVSTDSENHRKFAKEFDCFEVSGASTPAYEDYCAAHYNSLEPFTVTNHDLVTITYNGDFFMDNNLDDAIDEENVIYLLGTAWTTDGTPYSLTTISEKNAMSRINPNSRDFIIGLWPVDFFGVPLNKTIERIEYYFSSADQQDVQMEVDEDDGTESPFVNYFYCN